MVTTLLLVCIGFILLLTFAVIVLFVKMGRMKEIERNQQALLQETEHLLSTYMLEMKAENERIVEMIQQQRLASLPQAKVQPIKPKVVPPPQQRVRQAYDVSSLLTETKDTVQLSSAVPVKEQPVAIPPEPQTPEEQMVALAKTGLTAEQIARQLNRGLTEVQLVLKFHLRESK